MSVESEILRIQHNIANTYAAVTDKGGEVPLQPTSANLAAAVASIPVGVTQEELSQALLTKQDKLVGAPGQVVGFNAQGAAQAVQGWSNPNLLINGDFRKPVNRNGETEYAGKAHTIDRWTGISVLTIHPGFIRISPRSDVSVDLAYVEQVVNKEFCKPGLTITASTLFSGGSETKRLEIIYLSDGDPITAYSNNVPEAGIATVTSVIPEGVTSTMIRILAANIGPSNQADIIAAKLEWGVQQTLARQNEDGEWEIIDPPDYDLQYVLCSLYSPITGKWVGNQHSNPNLLDNWYFIDPINQRGIVNLDIPSGTFYWIDRWIAGRIGENVIGNITLEDGGVTLNNVWIAQPFSDHSLDGCELTASVMTSDGAVFSGTAIFQYDVLSANLIFFYRAGGLEMYAQKRGDDGRWMLALKAFESFGTLKLKAAKLELGPVQTLAHQDADGNWVLNDPPPNKALELAKCQRYFVRVPYVALETIGTTTSYSSWINLQLSGPSMRITHPAISISSELVRISDGLTLPAPSNCTARNGNINIGFAHFGTANVASYIYGKTAGYIDLDANL